MRLRLEGDGPPVVKLPGLAGGVELYREEIDAAVAAGFRIAALDNTGDRADDPARRPITWELLIDEAAAAVDRAGDGPAILWGTSFGCLTALAAAAHRPERVRGLLLCVPPDPGRLPALHRRSVELALGCPDPGRGSRIALALGMVLFCGWEFLAPPAMRRLRSLWRASCEAATPHSTIRDKFGLLLDGAPAREPVSAPVSIVAGGWDLLTPCRGARRLVGRLPDSRLHVFRASGHALAWSRPRGYARAAVEELERLSRAS